MHRDTLTHIVLRLHAQSQSERTVWTPTPSAWWTSWIFSYFAHLLEGNGDIELWSIYRNTYLRTSPITIQIWFYYRACIYSLTCFAQISLLRVYGVYDVSNMSRDLSSRVVAIQRWKMRQQPGSISMDRCVVVLDRVYADTRTFWRTEMEMSYEF